MAVEAVMEDMAVAAMEVMAVAAMAVAKKKSSSK